MKNKLPKLGITALTIVLFLTRSHAQTGQPGLKITSLTDNFYVYTTYHTYAGDLFPSNSLYVVTSGGVVLIDTPWDTAQCRPLLDSIEQRHGKKAVFCLSTHFHADRTAGLDYFKSKGIQTFSSCQTLKLCRERGERQAASCFEKDTAFAVSDLRFETFYPGEGHAPDNIVVWFPKEKILYGGCFLKSTEHDNLGNLSDANLPEWAKSVKNTRKKYRRARFIIPGHFGWQGDGLRHTARLLRKTK